MSLFEVIVYLCLPQLAWSCGAILWKLLPKDSRIRGFCEDLRSSSDSAQLQATSSNSDIVLKAPNLWSC